MTRVLRILVCIGLVSNVGQGSQHLGLAFENRAFVYLQDRGLNGAAYYGGRLDFDALSSENIAGELARDDNDVRLNLAGDLGFVADYQNVRSKNFPFELTVDTRRAF